jgi:hypothetical protein
MKTNLLTFLQCVDNTQSRREVWEGQDYMVFPVVALVEGVHHNSRGACYYPAEEVGRLPEAWNGIPVPIFHPEKAGDLVSANDPQVIAERSVGRTFNFYYEDGKLKGEVWINISKANRIFPGMLASLNTGGRLEVSTGHFSEDEEITGSWNSEPYDYILRNYVPDHLALLPGGQGACSWEDGCGIRANKKGGENMPDEEIQEITDKLKENTTDRKTAHTLLCRLKALIKHKMRPRFLDNEVSFEDTTRALQKVVDAMDSSRWMHYVRKVYDKDFVYVAEPNYETNASGQTTFWRQKYSINKNGQVTLSEDGPVEVIEKPVEFVIKTNMNNQILKEDLKMASNKNEKCCDEQIQLLIENEATKWTEDDREILTAMSKQQIDKLMPEEGDQEPTAVQKAVAKTAANSGIPVEGQQTAEGQQTPEDFLKANKNVPAEIAAAYRKAKDGLVDIIMANEKNNFTKEQLQKWSMEDLENVAEMVKVTEAKSATDQESDFSANAGVKRAAIANNDDDDEPLELPTMDFASKK